MYPNQYSNPDWNQRNDNVPGWVYIVQADKFHGIIPGVFLRRCKIGYSRNPQMRLENFHMNQPPCNIRIIKTIYVEDMKAVEGKLHQRFKRNQVKLKRSREWFDFTPLEFLAVLAMMTQLDAADTIKNNQSIFGFVILNLIGTLVLGTILGQSFSQPAPQPQPQSVNRVERNKPTQKPSHRKSKATHAD